MKNRHPKKHTLKIGTFRVFPLLLALLVLMNMIYSGIIPITAEEDVKQEDYLTLENTPEHIRDIIEPNISAGAVLTNDNYEDLYSMTLANPDGTKTCFAFSERVKFKDSDNKIKFKNDKLKKVNKLFSTYEYENGENTFNAYFPKKIKDGILMETENYSIRFRPFTNKNIKAEKKMTTFHEIIEEVVEYADVFGTGTALQYKTLMDGIKENIVLNEYKGQNIFQFYIDLENLEPATLEAETIPLLDPETKEIVAVLGQPDARDSYSGEYSEDECHYTLSNRLKLTKEKKNWVLSVIIDKNFLESETTVYPVVIDPTVVKHDGGTSIEDTTIYSSSDENYCTYLSLVAGYTDARYGEGRILVKYKDINKFSHIIPENIIDATFHIYETSNYTNEILLRLYEVEQLWNQTTVTWNNCPRIGNFVCDQHIKHNKQYFVFPIRELFQSWLSTYKSTGTNNGYSFMLQAFRWDGMEMPDRREFASSHWMVEKKPYFEVTYTERFSFTEGVYFIKNQQSGKYLDIENKNTASGANVLQWEFTGELSQQWRVKKVNDSGYYTIHPVIAPTRALRANGTENESNIVIYGTNYTGNSAWWKINFNGYADSTYRLYNYEADGKTMVVRNASMDNGANVFLYDYSPARDRNDDWVFERADKRLNTPMILQPDGYGWCWAACADMLAKTYNIKYTRSQQDAVIHVKGYAKNEGGTMSETEQAAEYISNNQIDFYSAPGRIYSENILTKLIMNGHPVIMGIYSFNADGNEEFSKGHGLIVYGSFYRLEDGKHYFRIKDPLGGDFTLTYEELLRFGEKRWAGIVTRNLYYASETIPRVI